MLNAVWVAANPFVISVEPPLRFAIFFAWVVASKHIQLSSHSYAFAFIGCSFHRYNLPHPTHYPYSTVLNWEPILKREHWRHCDLTGRNCPLGVPHPPHGTTWCLGCAECIAIVESVRGANCWEDTVVVYSVGNDWCGFSFKWKRRYTLSAAKNQCNRRGAWLRYEGVNDAEEWCSRQGLNEPHGRGLMNVYWML